MIDSQDRATILLGHFVGGGHLRIQSLRLAADGTPGPRSDPVASSHLAPRSSPKLRSRPTRPTRLTRPTRTIPTPIEPVPGETSTRRAGTRPGGKKGKKKAKRDAKKLKKVVKRGGVAKAKLKIVFADEAGNKDVEKLRLKLK